MSESPRFSALVDGLGRLRFDLPELWAAKMHSLIGKRVTVEVRREKDVRSAAQNRLMWGTWTSAVAEAPDWIELATGQPVLRTPEDVHGIAKLSFLTRPAETNRGMINLLGTTTNLTPGEFSELIERTIAKLAQYGVYVPPYGEDR